jgi:hypothetical protein
VEKIRARLTELFVLTDGYLQVPKKRELPSAQNLKENADAFAQALNKYLAEYEKAGIYPKHIAAFLFGVWHIVIQKRRFKR